MAMERDSASASSCSGESWTAVEPAAADAEAADSPFALLLVQEKRQRLFGRFRCLCPAGQLQIQS